LFRYVHVGLSLSPNNISMKKNWSSRLCSFHWDFGFDFFENDVKK